MLLWVLASLSIQHLRVSDSTIRLPFAIPDEPENPHMVLTAFNSHVKWAVKGEPLVKVTPIESKSENNSVVVEVISTAAGATKIQAISSKGDSAYINVFIAPIDHASVRTRNKVLYVNSSVETYILEILDKDNNTFNKFDGYQFEFFFNKTKINEVPPEEPNPEYERHLSPKIRIQGMDVGKSAFKASIAHRVFTEPIELTVVEPFYLFPDYIVHLLPGAKFQFKLCSERGLEHQQHRETCNNPIALPDPQFKFIATNDTAFTSDSTGLITANSPGQADLIVEDTIMPLNKESSHAIVTMPVRGIIPEQWIKVGTIPVANATFFDNEEQILIAPSYINWEISGDYHTIGTHEVTFKAFGIEIIGIVHVCEPIKFNPSKMRISKFSPGFQSNLTGGSGNFTWTLSNQTIVDVLKGFVIPKDFGKCIIKVVDNRIPEFVAELKVKVEPISKAVFDFPYREILVGEKINYSVAAYNAKNKPLSYLPALLVASSNNKVITQELIAKSVGFANITATIGTTQSSPILFSVISPLQIVSSLCGTSKKKMNLNRHGGPVQWVGHEKPNEQIICGSANPKLNGSEIVLNEEYQGICTLIVQNIPCEANPRPIKAVANVNITLTAITRLALVVTDIDSINNENCDLALSQYSSIDSVPTHSRIPVNHRAKIEVVSFDKKNNTLGKFYDPDMEVNAEFKNGSSLQIDLISGSFELPIDSEIHITLSEPDIPKTEFTIIPVFHHKMSSPPDLYSRSQRPASVEIIDGSGFFSAEGRSIKLEGRNLIAYPTDQPSRDLIVRDVCIPENTEKVRISTVVPKELVINGPSYGVVGQGISLNCSLVSTEGKIIDERYYDLEKWSYSPKMNEVSLGKYILKLEKLGRIQVSVAASEFKATHAIDVFESIAFNSTYIEMFEGETRSLPAVIGSFSLLDLQLASDNDTIAKVDESLNIIADHQGITEIRAFNPKFPVLTPAVLTVKVIAIRDLNMVSLASRPYEGSHVIYQVSAETDEGRRNISNIAWSVEGNSNWTRLSDPSEIVIFCNKEGEITVTAKVFRFEKFVKFHVDYKLSVTTPKRLLLPIGSSFHIEVSNPIKPNYSSELSVKDGHISCTKIGKYAVNVTYNQQWETVDVTVSIPKALYISPISQNSFKAVLLDEDGQIYSDCEGVKFTCGSIEIMNRVYALNAEQEATETTFTIIAQNSNFLIESPPFIHSPVDITPPNQIVQVGSQLQYRCRAAQPEWKSINPRVASVDPYGKVKTENNGKTFIQCTKGIETSLSVVNIDDIDLNRIKPDLYEIRLFLSDRGVDPKKVSYIDDLEYKCEWMAKDCGSAKVEKSDNGVFCKIAISQKHICPSQSLLVASANSRKAGLRLNASTFVNYQRKIDWGIDAETTVFVSEQKKTAEVKFVKPKEPIETIVSDGLAVEFKTGMMEITADIHKLNEESSVIMEHKESGEQVRIRVKKAESGAQWKQISVLDSWLFGTSIVLTFALGIYVAYHLGEGALLPPLSPYKSPHA